MNFIAQSNLQADNKLAPFGLTGRFGHSVSSRATLRMSLIYTGVWIVGLMILAVNPTLALAMVMPGGGFAASAYPLILIAATLGLFGVALFLWFATGNVIGPFVIWIAALLISLSMADRAVSPIYTSLAFAIVPVALAGLWALKYGLWQWRKVRLQALNVELSQIQVPLNPSEVTLTDEPRELSNTQMAQMRFFLDRALQPISEFEGFEHLDDFQTAAVRYQINFISYALSMAQYNCLPALGAYLTQAQVNLKAKQEQPEIWRYWAKESAWGNLELSRDPVAKDNIMYSGFVATQMMMALKASPHCPEGFMGKLGGKDKDFEFSYTQDQLIERLTEQYETAQYGLLPCEPNWVYPLCNFITAAAIRGFDTEHKTHHWEGIKHKFRHMTDQEFLGIDGHFVPFRSAYTGLATPQVGGLIMQTFPCFFLNSLYPDMAQRQWWLMRKGLKGRSLRRACWPIDVGNYNFSRAAAYAASALASAEIGDRDLKDELLSLMDEDCAPVLDNGRYYYSKASIWANANAFMAGLTSQGDFQRLMNNQSQKTGPFIDKADPDEIMFSSAYQQDGALFFKAHPQNGGGYKPLQIAGLKASATYQLIHQGGTTIITSNHLGKADINIALFSPSQFQLLPKS